MKNIVLALLFLHSQPSFFAVFFYFLKNILCIVLYYFGIHIPALHTSPGQSSLVSHEIFQFLPHILQPLVEIASNPGQHRPFWSNGRHRLVHFFSSIVHVEHFWRVLGVLGNGKFVSCSRCSWIMSVHVGYSHDQYNFQSIHGLFSKRHTSDEFSANGCLYARI